MKNKLFFCLLGLLLTATGYAQQTSWWGYWTATGQSRTEQLAPGDGRHDYGIRLMPADSVLRDGQIHGMRFLLSDKSAVRRAWIWVSARPFKWDGDAGPDMALKEIDLSDLRDLQHGNGSDDDYTEVYFDAPVDVLPSSNKRSNCYVGYSIELAGTEASPCRPISGGPDGWPSWREQQGYACFADWQNVEQTAGPLALQLRVSGPRIGRHAACAMPIETIYATAGSSLGSGDGNRLLTIALHGTEPVDRITYEVSIGDGPAQPTTVSFHPALTEIESQVVLPLEATLPAEAALYDCTVNVTHVNGEPNEDAWPQTPFALYSLSQMPLTTMVMEEYTGTWCPNCPRGDVGLRLLDEYLGDRFIGISVHNGDPMTLPAYDKSASKRKFCEGYPSSAVNRAFGCDPYQGFDLRVKRFQMYEIADAVLQQPTVADMGVTAQWDETLPVVRVDAAATFRFSAAEAPYSIALLLTADSLTGDGSDWLQVNTYAGSEEWDSYMDEYTQGERRVKMAYNHVAVAVKDIDTGSDGSISAPIAADVAQHYMADFDLSDNKLIQDRNRLHAIALLLDTRTGEVVNAAKAHVQGAAEGITLVSDATAAPASYYAPDGRQLSARPRGLVIVRRSDGRVRKEMVY